MPLSLLCQVRAWLSSRSSSSSGGGGSSSSSSKRKGVGQEVLILFLMPLFSLLSLSGNAPALWVAVGAYGFFNGPTVGYCYDL